MKLQTMVIAALVILVAGFASGFGVRGYMASKDKLAMQVADLEADKQEFKDYIGKAENQVAKYNALQDKLYSLDTTSSKELNEQLTENNRLRGDLATAQRMRLKGATCVGNSAAAQDGTAGSVGDGASVVLSGETRQAVLDLRGDLLRDRGKILYLQGYLQGVGLAPPAIK